MYSRRRLLRDIRRLQQDARWHANNAKTLTESEFQFGKLEALHLVEALLTHPRN